MSFCSLTKGITLKICRLCFVLINSILLNFSMFHVFGSYSKYSNLESWKKKEKWNFPSLVHVDLVCFSFSLSGPCGIELYLHQLRHQATVFLHAGQSCCNGHHHHCCFHYSALRYLANKSLETVLSAHTRARAPTHAHTHTHTHTPRASILTIQSSKQAASARETWNGWWYQENRTFWAQCDVTVNFIYTR